jgi:hypothetical protein
MDKRPKENRGEKLLEIGLGSNFLDTKPKALVITSRIQPGVDHLCL